MILKWLSKFWPVLILLIFTGIVAWKNVIPGTFLTGWDNLHPEFDFKTNIIDRGINGVWQYYQGLGVPSGNAHVADLPRQIVLWVASWVLPQNLIRYGYHLLAWLGGGIGLYFLILKMLAGEIDYRKKQVVALVGSIFYLFNLGTLQNFYAPYESFSHFYLMLPWLIYALLSYFCKGGRKRLLLLALVNLLAVPMSYIPTIFIVYTLVLGLIGTGELISSRLKNWKRMGLGIMIILIVNSFWLMPFVQFILHNTKGVVDAKINRMFTQEAYLRNEEYGEQKHSLIMEGFWFDTTDMTRVEGEHDFMMSPWMEYMSKPGVKGTMWALVVVVAIGYVYALFRCKRYVGIFGLITLIGLFALTNTNWPSAVVFKYLQDNLPLFGQVLRFPYTKFILLVVIGYSVGIAWFVEMIMKYLRSFGYFLGLLITCGILFVQRPVFEGHFFYDNLRLKIPDEYFELFKYFQNEDRFRGRIANLPQPTFWGWTTYGWGYRGSGFPWYGIPQPMLDRNFDVWSPESEEYYAELSNAIYNNDSQEYFLSVLDKYGIDYIWIDGWIINPHKPELLDMNRVNGWLINGGYDQSYTTGKQIIYKRRNPVTQNGVRIPIELRTPSMSVSEISELEIDDSDYVRYGDRVFKESELPIVVSDRYGDEYYGYTKSEKEEITSSDYQIEEEYIFSEIFPDLDYDERTWWIGEIYIAYESEQGEGIEICLYKNNSNNCHYIGSNTNPTGGYRWGRFELADTTSPSELKYKISGNATVKELRFGVYNAPSHLFKLEQDGDSPIIVRNYSLVENQVSPKNCYLFGKGTFDREIIKEDNSYVRYSATDASSCETMLLGDSEIFASGGELQIETKNINGRPIKICLRHDPPGSCLVEEIIDTNTDDWVTSTYIIPPVTKLGDIYLELDNYAVGREVRINDVSNIKLSSSSVHDIKVLTEPEVYWNNQAYRKGWVGLLVESEKLKVIKLNHVKVDGWSNGWIVKVDPPSPTASEGRGGWANGFILNNESGSTNNANQIVVIFYWPQLLQYLGFVLLGITGVGLLYGRKG